MSDEKLLLKEFKKAGLNIGEDAVMKVVDAVFKAVPEFLAVKAASGKINPAVVALVSGILPVIKPILVELVDQIDGENDHGAGSEEE